MLTGYTEFANVLRKKEISFLDKRFNRFVNSLYIQLVINNYDEEKYKSIKESQIIVIDSFEETDHKYFAICFNEILIIVEQFNQKIIKKLFTDVNESKIFIFNTARQNFVKISDINENKLNCDQESLNIFNKEYSSFKDIFFLHNIYKSDIKQFWSLIQRCVSGYMIKKSYLNSNINREKFFLLNFDNLVKAKKYNENEFIKLRIINNSATSTIYLAYHFNREQIFCIKTQNDADTIEREIENCKKLYFPFIPRYFGTTKDDNQESCIIEFINGHMLSKIENSLSNINKMIILIQIVYTIHYLHSMDFIYRDLKPSNVIIDQNKTAVLIDYDLMIESNRTDKNKTEDYSRGFATIFAAPEICEGCIRPSFETDIYSVGMMIYYLFTGNDKEIRVDDFKNKYPKMYEIFEKCTSKEMKNRPTADKLTVYLKDYISESLDELISNEKVTSKDEQNDIIVVLETYIYFGSVISTIFRAVSGAIIKKDSKSQNDLGQLYLEGQFIPPNKEKAVKYLTLAADQNDMLAQHNLGEYYYESKKIDKAIEYYLLSAEQQNDSSQLKLGLIYYEGKYVPKNIEKAIYYFKLAAEHYNLDALNNLGIIYLDIDINKSFDYYNQAIQQNHPKALYNVGVIYLSGKHVKKDVEKAVHYFKLAADKKFVDALRILGSLYSEGTDVDPDINKAIYYYEIAAQLNDVESIVNLGNIYFTGDLIPRNIDKAIKCFTVAAIQNSVEAQYNLGIIYSSNRYVHCDIEKSLEYFSLAANQNSADAQYNLGAIYINGVHIPRDVNKGIHYLTLSANNNHPIAQFQLGIIYLTGVDVPRDVNKGIHYLTLSANQNYADAQFELGYLYYEAKYIPRDIKKAVNLLTLAANQNQVRAQYELGLFYLNGKHVKHDIKKAINLFTQAAKQGHLKAIINLGVIYSECNEIPKDLDKAIYYFKIASDKNNAKSQYLLGSIYFKEYKVFDINKSIHYMSLAADQNHMNAQNFLGALYLDGKFVNRDITKSIHYLTLAANNHCITAQKNLGFLYYENKYVERDMKKAMHYLTLAANGNYPACQAMLGILYSEGKLVPLNIEKALDYLNQSVKNNDHLGQRALGDLYLEGKYVNRDIKRAIYLYKEVLVTSDPSTKNNLAVIYLNGFNTVGKNILLAKEYLEEAVKSNFPLSMFNLAKIYYEDEIKKKSTDNYKSLDLLIKSGEMGLNPSITLIIIIWTRRFKKLNQVLIENELKKHNCNSSKLSEEIFMKYLLLMAFPSPDDTREELMSFIQSNDMIKLYNDILFTTDVFDAKEVKSRPEVVQKMMTIDKNFFDGMGIDSF